MSGGGRDPLIGCYFSDFIGNPSTTSHGRAPSVPPGSPLCTGVTSKNHQNLEQEYDEKRCTMQREAKWVNFLKYCFYLGEDWEMEFLTWLPKLLSECRYYDKIDDHLPPLDYKPKDWTKTMPKALWVDLLPTGDASAEEAPKLESSLPAAEEELAGDMGNEVAVVGIDDIVIPGDVVGEGVVLAEGLGAAGEASVPVPSDLELVSSRMDDILGAIRGLSDGDVLSLALQRLLLRSYKLLNRLSTCIIKHSLSVH